jgi:hypothetical protein
MRGMGMTFSAAPWPRVLKVTSALGTVLIVSAGVAAYRTLPLMPGPARVFGLAIALILPAILAVSLFFMVTGYVADERALYIKRLASSTRISLTGLSEIRLEPGACRGAIRLFGNGGLYAFTGWYRNSAIGRFRLFGTDLDRSVILVLPQGKVVVTPENPHAFVEYLKRRIPTAHAAQQDALP